MSMEDDDAKSSSRSVDDNLEKTTTTVVSKMAMQQTTIFGRCRGKEQQVQDFKEELALALANSGGYQRASLNAKLKVAQDHRKNLEEQNARLQKMNKIQKEVLFELIAKHKGLLKGTSWMESIPPS